MFRFSNKKALSQGFRCRIKLLVPGEEIHLDYTQGSTGQDIFDELVSKLDLHDKDYYGLKINNQIQWIDLSKTIVKQTKGIENVVFDLRFKYYPAEPPLLANESTRYYLYLQLRMDLLEGRLRTDDHESLAFLIACVLQSELGDNNIDLRKTECTLNSNYVSEFKFVPNQTEQLELEAIKLHQNEDFVGLKPAESELNFLKKACKIDMYGIDPYPVRDGNSRNHLLIGVNHLGISTFLDSKKVNQFLWVDIERIALDNRLVLIYCKKIEKKGVKGRPLFGFRCPSQEHAHCFWKIASEHRYFFTLESTPDLPIVTTSGGLFRKNHKIRYSGRVEKDLLRYHLENNDGDSTRKPLKRSHSLLSKTDRPQWQGFEQGANLQGSLNNIYANDLINRTMPSNLDCLREEDEDRLGDCTDNQDRPQSSLLSKQRKSSASLSANKESAGQFTGRRPNLMTKTEYMANGINNYNILDDNKSNVKEDIKLVQDGNNWLSNLGHDVMKISVFLVTISIVALVVMLVLDESDRPNSINTLMKKTNVEPVFALIRENLYIPARASIRRLVCHLTY